MDFIAHARDLTTNLLAKFIAAFGCEQDRCRCTNQTTQKETFQEADKFHVSLSFYPAIIRYFEQTVAKTDSNCIIGAMIILSIGMPRAGSGWFYNLTNDLMLANGAQDARQIRQRYHLQNILTEVNCNIGAFTTRRLLGVLAPSLLGNTFVIKAHAGPTPFALWLIRRGMILPTYIYRDPRDAMLSAMENGARARQQGRENAFSHLDSFENALDFMKEYVKISQAWLDCSSALHVRYESLLIDYDGEAARLANFLGLRPRRSHSTARSSAKYRPEGAPSSEQKGLHFSHGKIGRFRQKMSSEQQEQMLQVFGAYLDRMGYER